MLTYTTFMEYAEGLMNYLKQLDGYNYTEEIVNKYLKLKPFLESEEYDFLLAKMLEEQNATLFPCPDYASSSNQEPPFCKKRSE